MQVLKVMNNSLVLALDEAGTECILMGKGIGYNKAIGHEIQDDEIEKVFILTDNKMLTNFVQLASTLDDKDYRSCRDQLSNRGKRLPLFVFIRSYLIRRKASQGGKRR